MILRKYEKVHGGPLSPHNRLIEHLALPTLPLFNERFEAGEDGASDAFGPALCADGVVELTPQGRTVLFGNAEELNDLLRNLLI